MPFLFLTVLCLAHSLTAQNYPSADKKNSKVHFDTAQVNKITREARKLVMTGQYEEASKQIQRAEILAKKEEDINLVWLLVLI